MVPTIQPDAERQFRIEYYVEGLTDPIVYLKSAACAEDIVTFPNGEGDKFILCREGDSVIGYRTSEVRKIIVRPA